MPVSGKAAEPLYSSLKKSNKIVRSTDFKRAVTELKKKRLEAHLLEYSIDRDPYTITTDASLTGVGAILTKKQGTEDIVIAYANKTLNKSQWNYSATKREIFTIVHFTQHFKNYLLGKYFLIITDNRVLVWIYSFSESIGIIARWIGKLEQFSFDIKHRKGKKSHALTVCCA